VSRKVQTTHPGAQPKFRAVVALCIGEHLVDTLIEELNCLDGLPRVWIVFGDDLDALGAVQARWSSMVYLIPVFFERRTSLNSMLVELILEREGLTAEGCIWLSTRTSPAVQMGSSVLDVEAMNREQLIKAFRLRCDA
jgi:hypothetical protein